MFLSVRYHFAIQPIHPGLDSKPYANARGHSVLKFMLIHSDTHTQQMDCLLGPVKLSITKELFVVFV